MYETYETYGHPGLHGIPPQPEAPWDPTENLAYLLQDAITSRQPEPFEPFEPFEHVGFGEDDTISTADLVAGLTQTTAERPHTHTSGGHRRTPPKAPVVTLLRTGSLFTATLVALIAAVVSVLSGMAICETLRHSAGPHTAHEVVNWWPLLIYGPWMVASLSILRAALHQRRALHSWSIVLLFSTLATLLCVAEAPRTLAAGAAAALPAVAALACFQQLVRQITLTRPPRQATPRHRHPTSSPLGQPATPKSSPGSALSDHSVTDRKTARSPAPAPTPAHGFRYGA
ncbi:hypothetical protein [Streptomyces sp. NPDC002054]|uniref:hypothetical protein n=1 Tax=Streptomyces sp. NPDC002054 TaxID=3154663 RepID=UPI003333212D